ncbi:DHA1 family purine ribonucleoside efflux pump-like MFS transporter [Rathayibacter sp. PhB152]|nr:DHA1 family purine ribonucleoside efflux pump-like MFS transporter [Rathayibacter sp. PhB152]
MATTSSPGDPRADDVQPPKTTSWIGVVSLSVGVFALVMAEFLPASLLSPMAGELGVTEGVAGQSVSITAVIAAVAGLLVPVLFSRVDRRHLMIALSIVAALSNILVALAPNYPVLLLARVLLGIAIGGFWSLSISLTSRLVPAAKLGLGLTVVQVGVSLATVAAVPLGTFLGELWGWRAVFFLAAAVGIIAMALQFVALPSIRSAQSAGFRPLFQTLRSRLIVLGMTATALMGAGHFAGFTYIRPAATQIGGLTPEQLALLLLAYGIGIVLGNLVAGPLADRSLHLAVFIIPFVLGAAMILFAALDAGAPGIFTTVVLWGAGFGALPVVVSTWLARAEPERLESVGGLQTAVFQLAVALGALVGGVLVDGAGVQTALIAGGIAVLVGSVLIVLVKPRALA